MPALGHDFAENGYCARCDAFDSSYVKPEECKHEETYCVYTEPTCTEDGYYKEFCVLCKEIRNEYTVYAQGHSFTGGYCTTCGAEDEAYVKPESCYHTNYSTVEISATCTEPGIIRYVCDDCEYVLNEVEMPPYGHEPDEDGKCIACGKMDDENLETETSQCEQRDRRAEAPPFTESATRMSALRRKS